MSWFAVHYVLRKSSHPLVKGVPKFLLLVISYFVRTNHTITPLLSIRQLQDLLGVDEKTIRRNRDLLCSPDVGELTRHVHGKREAFEMLKLCGPLFVDRRFDYASRIRANSPDLAAGVTTQIRANSPDLRNIRAICPDVSARTYKVLEEEVGSKPSSSPVPRNLPQLLVEVQRFVDWWTVTYPTENIGALSNIRDCDRDAAYELLQSGRTVERLQLMAIAMWRIVSDGRRGSNRWYIAVDSDRSIRVLQQKADFLDQEVGRLKLDAPSNGEAAAAERAAQRDLPAHIDRVLEHLRQPIIDTSISMFGELLVRIAEELSTIDITDSHRAAARLEVLDVEMLRAARAAAVDVEQMQAEATTQLASFRGRITDEAYQRARSAAIDSMIRQRFHLPVLEWLGAGVSRPTVAPAERTG